MACISLTRPWFDIPDTQRMPSQFGFQLEGDILTSLHSLRSHSRYSRVDAMYYYEEFFAQLWFSAVLPQPPV